jgi:hypothetical protein
MIYQGSESDRPMVERRRLQSPSENLLHGDFKSRPDVKVDFHDKVSVADQQHGSCRIGRYRRTIGRATGTTPYRFWQVANLWYH